MNPTRIRLAAALSCVALVLALGSCATIQRDILMDAQPGSSAARLDELERELVGLRAWPDKAALQAVRSELDSLAQAPSSDSAQKARLASLRAEAALQSGDQVGAAAFAKEARAAYAGDELSVVVASRLARSADESLTILDAGAATSDGVYRIKAEKGSVLAAAGRYSEALASFDAALPHLPDEYSQLYGALRERAYALRGQEGAPQAATADYLNSAALPLVGMAVLAQSETTSLDWLTGGASWSPGVLFDRLKAAGWYTQEATPSQPATRGDAALFLWHLMARGDAKTLSRYSARYAGRASSPVPDVPIGSEFFDGALGVVEEGVMALVDGRSFAPVDTVSGLDFYPWLRAAAAWR